MIAAIYARKSTEQRGADEEQKSVARQVANATAFAAARGWTVDAAHIYIDDGISGAESRRLLAKQRLLDLARSGRCPFGVVVMQAQDRLSRRDGDEAFGELKTLAKQCEVWFYADGRRFEHGTFASNTLGLLHGQVAAEFRRSIAAKTFEAMKRRG
jgi:DNA invertase Pin-like site-specific DNA recombinase